jgi:hypothetical protein
MGRKKKKNTQQPQVHFNIIDAREKLFREALVEQQKIINRIAGIKEKE